MKEFVINSIEQDKKENKGMTVFQVLGNDEKFDIINELDQLNAKYHVSKIESNGDLKPYDITVDLLSV